MRIQRVWLIVFMMPVFGLVACDQSSSGSNSIDQVNKDIASLNAESREKQRKQIEEDGVAVVDDQHLDEMGNILENAADNASGKQAEVLREQAELIRELQRTIQAYDSVLNELIEAGGIDAASVSGPEDIANRLDIIERLAAQNERMAVAHPRILRRMGEIEGTMELINKQLVIHGQLRELDRQLFAAMKKILGHLGNYHEGMEVQDDGMVVFGEDMPDEVLVEYNDLIDEVNRLSTEQGQLQLELLELVS